MRTMKLELAEPTEEDLVKTIEILGLPEDVDSEVYQERVIYLGQKVCPTCRHYDGHCCTRYEKRLPYYAALEYCLLDKAWEPELPTEDWLSQFS